MKKLIMVFAIVGACTTAAVAQDSSAATKNSSDKMVGHQSKDHVAMKDGKVVLVKGGTVSTLGSDLTLNNGTVVKSDGTVKSSDGTTTKLQEGEKLDMDGNKIIKKDQTSVTPPQQ